MRNSCKSTKKKRAATHERGATNGAAPNIEPGWTRLQASWFGANVVILCVGRVEARERYRKRQEPEGGSIRGDKSQEGLDIKKELYPTNGRRDPYLRRGRVATTR